MMKQGRKREKEEGREREAGGDIVSGHWWATGALGGPLRPPLPPRDHGLEREIKIAGREKRKEGRQWRGCQRPPIGHQMAKMQPMTLWTRTMDEVSYFMQFTFANTMHSECGNEFASFI